MPTSILCHRKIRALNDFCQFFFHFQSVLAIDGKALNAFNFFGVKFSLYLL